MEEVDAGLTIEEETDDIPYVEFDISVAPSDPTLELLSDQIKRQDIIIPFYQRKFVWKIEQASRLIESFLMGLPVPQVFLYVNSEDQLEVIDGQQRLMSVKYFFEGYFGEEDSSGKRQVFKLKGLSQRSEYNDKTFNELNQKDQRKLKNSTLRAINIKQLKPGKGNDSVFHIFERLNTGGTQLKPQEIRNAVYRGNIVSQLESLNRLPEWQSILGLKKPDKNQKDVELILRLFSLFENWQHYEKPMIRFLNQSMSQNRNFDTERAVKFMDRFKKTVVIINSNIARPFRPRGVINSAVLESVMVALMESEQISGDTLQDKYSQLLNDQQFQERFSGATTDTISVKSRLEIAKKVLLNGAD